MSLFCNNNFVKMNNLEQFDLKEAKKTSLREVFEINESHKPMLSSLGDLGKLEDLIELSTFGSFFVFQREICAFIVCMREDLPYESPNYKYFQNKYKKFLYIDRVGVKKGLENRGFGSFMYGNIFENYINERLIICAEANIEPINKQSLKFHEKMGFRKVEEHFFNNKYGVAYLERNF
tara:strand:- start:146 stop:679 length:534 start_codon:yes stop_codon:yes gene_type:complete